MLKKFLFILVPLFFVNLFAFELKAKNQQAQTVTPTVLQEPKQIVQVTHGVSVAVGYSFANMILIEGKTGLIVVDSLSYPERAVLAYKDLTKNITKPLVAIILTHFHLDHIGGANAIKEEFGDENTKIYSHSRMEYERSRFSRLTEYFLNRINHHFGKDIYSAKYTSCLSKNQSCLDTATVTDIVENEQTIAGLDMEFYNTVGETNDHLSIWIPSKRALIVGDTVYSSFPNIYSLRGTPSRSAFHWYQSVTHLQTFNAKFLIMCHGKPFIGSEKVATNLMTYRDAIQYVHDQTIRLMNRGKLLSEIVEEVKLPAHLRRKQILRQIYGTVEWSVRGIYSNNNGWFDGKAEHLSLYLQNKKPNS